MERAISTLSKGDVFDILGGWQLLRGCHLLSRDRLFPHWCIGQFIKYMGIASWQPRGVLLLQLHTTITTHSCVISYFPSMLQIIAYFTARIHNTSLFLSSDTSSAAHAEPHLLLFPSKCYIIGGWWQNRVHLNRSLIDVHLKSCHAVWDILMILQEYALRRKVWHIFREAR